MASKEDKILINKVLPRLNILLKNVVDRAIDVKNEGELAIKVGYKRPGTISDVKNVSNTTIKKVENLLDSLAEYYYINKNYVLQGGAQPVFTVGDMQPIERLVQSSLSTPSADPSDGSVSPDDLGENLSKNDYPAVVTLRQDLTVRYLSYLSYNFLLNDKFTDLEESRDIRIILAMRDIQRMLEMEASPQLVFVKPAQKKKEHAHS